MSSQIANKIKINLCLVSNQFFIVRTIPCATFHYLTWITTICFNCYSSFTLLSLLNNNRLLDIYYQCTWRRMSLPCRNLYKCKQVACSVVVACLLVYPLFFILHFVVACLLLHAHFYYTDVVAIFLFIRWLFIIFVFRAFVYHFKNTINIFVTVCSRKKIFPRALSWRGKSVKVQCNTDLRRSSQLCDVPAKSKSWITNIRRENFLGVSQ